MCGNVETAMYGGRVTCESLSPNCSHARAVEKIPDTQITSGSPFCAVHVNLGIFETRKNCARPGFEPRPLNYRLSALTTKLPRHRCFSSLLSQGLMFWGHHKYSLPSRGESDEAETNLCGEPVCSRRYSACLQNVAFLCCRGSHRGMSSQELLLNVRKLPLR